MDVVLLIQVLDLRLYVVAMTVHDLFEIDHTRANRVLWHVRVVELDSCALLDCVWWLVRSSSVRTFEVMALVGLNYLIVVHRPSLDTMAAAAFILEAIGLILHSLAHESLPRPY